MVDRTIAAPARATTLAVVVTCGVTPYLGRTLAAVAAQSHHPGVVLLVDVAAPGRDIGTGEPLLEAVQRSGLEDVTHVRLVTTPEAATFGAAVSAGLEAYGQLVERAARRAVRREASLGGPVTTGSATGRSSFRLATGEMSPVTTGEMRAVTDGVLDAGAASYPDWLWLLHDDSAPGPHALDRQLRAAEAGRSLAVVGAKQVDWDEPDRLLEVGVLATRRARRVPDIEPREIDQGQHDHRQDVLAVGTAGMLVGATVWDELGGTDPVLGPFGDGLELSRRVRAAGYRVVVEPTAHVLHRRASYLGLRDAGDGGVRVVHPEDQAALDEAALDAAGPDAGARDARAEGAAAPDTEAPDGEALDPLGGPRPTHGGNPARSFAARRSAQLYNALVAARAWPLLALGYVLLGPLRAIWRMLGKDTPLAVGELVAVGRLVPRLGAVGRARRRVSSVGRAPRAALRELESGPADVRAARSTIRRQIATSRRLAEAPSELELAERADLARRRRLTLGLVVLVAFTIALPFVLPLVGGGQPVGGALAHLGRSAEELWTTARSTWTDAGVGHPGPADPLLTLTA
ncbi:MAG: glycosyltransferase, partial [Actinomycetaceae bacterium]